MSNYPEYLPNSGNAIVRGVVRVTDSIKKRCPLRGRPAMLEKLVQAAIITFLLHLIAGISPNTRVETKVALPMSETPASIVSLLFPSLR
ncbi:MAG: hypothetical protein RMY34_29345 [Aulosira sp. DedQUE10]|nr:hypothetical protein [Aulosira sp. DedQUE10]